MSSNILVTVVCCLCLVTLLNSQSTSSPGGSTPSVSMRPDVLACCAATGVELHCQARLCNFTLSENMDSSETIDCVLLNFEKVVTCYADGRDHSSCCQKRGVEDICMGYCDLSLLVPDKKCMSNLKKIRLCFEENYNILPGPPINIAARNVTPSSAVVTWERPVQLGNTVTSYVLYYKEDFDQPHIRNYDNPFQEIYNVSSPYSLAGLTGSSLHTMYLVSMNQYGSSLPSDSVQFRTTAVEPFGNNTIVLVPSIPRETSGDIPAIPAQDEKEYVALRSQNVSACCQALNVSSQCLHLCSYNATGDEIRQFRQLCRTDYRSLFRCFTDNRNHESCCRRRGVAERCVKMCAGERPGRLINFCNNVTTDILQCFEEGVAILPKQPEKVRIQERNTTWIRIAWDVPLDSPGNFTHHRLLYYHGNAVAPVDPASNPSAVMIVANITNAPQYTLQGLQPGQKYIFQVQSVNEHGTSLPSYAIDAWTLREDEWVTLAPRQLQLTETGITNLTISWLPPKKKLPDKFIVHYKQVSFAPSAVNTTNNESIPDGVWHQVDVLHNQTGYKIEGLLQDTKYEIYVTSVINGKDIEAHSVHIFPRTLELKSPKSRLAIFISDRSRLLPEEINRILSVQEETHVTFRCRGFGVPPPNVTLIHNNVTVMEGADPRTYKTVLRRNDIGKLKCTAKNGVLPNSQENLEVRVIFGPDIKPRIGTVMKGIGESAKLECIISVYPPAPEGSFMWEYQSKISSNWQRILGDNLRRYVSLQATNLPYQQNFQLRIKEIRDTDLGLYRCSDQSGQVYASVYLNSLDATPAPPRNASQLRQCCVDAGLVAGCLPACSYDWLSPEDLPEGVLETCIMNEDDVHLAKIVTCGADGRNHEPCCRRTGVPDTCLPFCRGVTPPSDTPDVHLCILHHERIITCMKEGMGRLPGPPISVNGNAVLDNMVRLYWNYPNYTHNPDKVDFYNILYRKQGDFDFVRLPVNVSELNWRVTGLEPGTDYEFEVEAINAEGSSLPSAIARVKTNTINIADKPLQRTDNPHWGLELAVGLVLALIVVLIAVAAVLFLLKRRRDRKSPTGAVTFENPGYDRNATASEEPAVHGVADSSVVENGNEEGWFHPDLSGGNVTETAIIVKSQYPVPASPQQETEARPSLAYESENASEEKNHSHQENDASHQ